MTEQAEKGYDLNNRQLLLPYLAPYVAYVGISTLLGKIVSIEWIYALRIIAVSALLVWAWQWYVPITGPRNKASSVGMGITAGLLGCVAWILLLRPFVDVHGGEPWTHTGFFLRLASASLLVPVFEEFLMRGYVFRLALQWDSARKEKLADPFGYAYEESHIGNVEPGAWSVWAIVISTLVFAAGHNISAWVPGIVYGALMSLLWIVRKDLLTCMVAHGVTNFTLASYIKATGLWGLW